MHCPTEKIAQLQRVFFEELIVGHDNSNDKLEFEQCVELSYWNRVNKCMNFFLFVLQMFRATTFYCLRRLNKRYNISCRSVIST